MKDNVSIIFASFIFVFLVVILPLFSVMDRQDNIAYNVVLNETSNFVDEVRANGFITQRAYEDYIAGILSTGNTYKVVLEAYRTTLIPTGTNNDEYTEQQEMYNTIDIQEYLTQEEEKENVTESNKNGNVFLLKENDNFYVRVYNTNITSGTLMYNMIVNTAESKTIDITYGGRVSNVNWELYDKVTQETLIYPKIELSVPMNGENEINIVPLKSEEELKTTTCQITEDLYGIFSDAYKNCEDSFSGDAYVYEYDLTQTKNRTIKLYGKFINVNDVRYGESSWIDITNLASVLDNSTRENYIIDNFISLKGMNADIDIDTVSGYYDYVITLSNVNMEESNQLSTIASLNILPNWGRSSTSNSYTNGVETVNMQLTDENAKSAKILGPYNWYDYESTKQLENVLENVYYKYGTTDNQDIFFRIQYAGIKDLSPNEIASLIKENSLITWAGGSKKVKEMDYITYTPSTILSEVGIKVPSNEIILRINNDNMDRNDISGKKLKMGLNQDWIEGMLYVKTDNNYELIQDEDKPSTPTFELIGTTNGTWYNTDVKVHINTEDNSSGIAKIIVNATGATVFENKDAKKESITLTNNGETTLTVYAEDYVGNKSNKVSKTIKIDKELPTPPTIELIKLPLSGIYEGSANIKITPGKDSISGVARTTYRIDGATVISERAYNNQLTISNPGVSTIIATTYDNAGNQATAIQNVMINGGKPPEVSFKFISGNKKIATSDWYTTGATLRVTVNYTGINEKNYFTYNINSGVNTTVNKPTSIVDIPFDNTGTYVVKVKTCQETGSCKEHEQTVKIDVDLPNELETDDIVKEPFNNLELGNAGWWKGKGNSNAGLKFTVNHNGDNGSGLTDKYSYNYKVSEITNTIRETDNTIQYNYVLQTETSDEKEYGKTFSIQGNGKHDINLQISDNAGNVLEKEETIYIDTDLPTAEFEIDATLKNGWYNKPITIQYKNGSGSDTTSGFERAYVFYDYDQANAIDERVEVPSVSLEKETSGDDVYLSVYDVAGNVNRKIYTTVKIDMTSPAKPEITLPGTENSSGVAQPQPLTGIISYNKSVMDKNGGEIGISLTDGEDNLSEVANSGVEETRYTITKNGEVYKDNIKYNTNILLSDDGFYSILAKTYDKAGNVSEVATQPIIIDTFPPEKPNVAGINDEYYAGKEYEDVSSTITIYIDNFEGGTIKVTDGLGKPYSNASYSTSEENAKITIALTTKKTYVIRIYQYDIYGNESSYETVTYTYK